MTRTSRATLLVAAAAALGAAPLVAQQPTQPAPQVTVGGLVYTQFTYQDAPIHFDNFDVKRAYINVIGRFSGGIYTRVTADIYNPPAGTGDSSRTYRIKYAYFAYTPTGSPLTFKLGEIHTPLLDWEEALWDYRMQGQMAMERGGYVSAADFGAGVDGRWGPDKVNAQFTLVNGEDYKGGTGDIRKDVMARVSARVMNTDDSSRVGGLRITAYGSYGKRNAPAGVRERLLGMVSYRSKQLTLALEAAVTRDSITTLINGHVYSAFGVYRVPTSKAAIIGRVDIIDPNAGGVLNKTTRLIGGVSYQLSPNVRLLADLDRLSFESGATARNQGLFQAQFTF